MIFDAEEARWILQSKKTQTRRMWKKCRYQAGKAYVLQVQDRASRDEPVLVTVLETRQEQLGDISLKDARAEGFRTTEDFRKHWFDKHCVFNEDEIVWVVRFVLGDHTDTPKLLAARMGGAEGDYVSIPSRAARGEGESPPTGVLNGYAKENRTVHGVGLAGQRERLGSVVAELARLAPTPRQRKRLKSIEHQIRALDLEAR